MKLIKCGHCGRPFYDEETACPYCGHAAHLSASNLVTRPISDPETHRLMEEGVTTEQRPTREPDSVQTLTDDCEAMAEPEPIAEPIAEAEPREEFIPSETVQERAENIAAITANEAVGVHETDPDEEEPNEVETTHIPHKRRHWPWVVLIIVLLLAGIVYVAIRRGLIPALTH